MEIEELKKAIDDYQDVTAGGIENLITRMNTIDSDLNTVVKKVNRPLPVDRFEEKSDHYELFEPYIRHGYGEQELKAYQSKAMSTNDDPNGGYFVPSEIDDEIAALVRNISPMRQLARVVKVRTTDIKFLVSQSDLASGWVGENEARPVTDAGTIAAIQPAFGEVYAEPKITQQLAEDSFINMGEWLAEDISDKFAEQEGDAFVVGTGINRPKGLLTYDTSTDADGTRDFGTIQYIAAGASGAFTTNAPEDKLIDLIHAVKPKHRQRGSWLMASETLAVIRKLKDSNGDSLWFASLSAGTPSLLLGYPVFEDASVPAIAANSLSIAFGDFRAAYLIADRVGTTVLRDPYTSKGNIIFYVRKRVGGSLINSEAVKVIKFSAS